MGVVPFIVWKMSVQLQSGEMMLLYRDETNSEMESSTKDLKITIIECIQVSFV